jgi:hypothetical protein
MTPMLTPTRWTVRISNGPSAWEDLTVTALSVETEEIGLRFYEDFDEVALFVPMARVIFLRLGT